jgi:hypothetical protein
MGRELLNPCGSDPLRNVSIEGENQLISKVYDRNFHDYYFILEKIESFSFRDLDVTDSRLALQLLVVTDVSLEIVLMNQQKQHKALHFSTKYDGDAGTGREFTDTMHEHIPLVLDVGKWYTLLLDFNKLTSECWGDAMFHSLDSLTVSTSHCYIRKIYSLHNEDCVAAEGDSMEDVILIDSIFEEKTDDCNKKNNDDNYKDEEVTEHVPPQDEEIATATALTAIEQLRVVLQKLNKIETDFIKEYGKMPLQGESASRR